MKIKRIFFLFVLFSSVVNAQISIPLYTDSIVNQIGDGKDLSAPDMLAFLPEKEDATGTAIVIFPGGAYQFLALQEEGVAIAEAFVKKGIAAFVVRYRLPNPQTMRDKSVGPLMDGQQAIKIVKERASEWNIDPSKVGVIGFSAGGHLAATLGTHFHKSYVPNTSKINLKPAFMVLVYPVVSMERGLTHMGSRINLLGAEPDSSKVNLFSNEEQVTEETPPTYLTHTGDDQVVDVKNSIIMYEALQRNKVPAELHLYPKGNHGFIQRLPVDEWLGPILLFLKKQGLLK